MAAPTVIGTTQLGATGAAAPTTTTTTTGKGKAAASNASGKASHTGLYKGDAVKDVAESLNISLNDAVATALAADIEYRIHQVVEEAARFMRHGRRTTLTTSDIDQAFRVLNIEPLFGHSSFNVPSYKRALPFPPGAGASASLPGQSASGSNQASSTGQGSTGPGPVWFVEDEEIDFDRVLREEKIVLPRGVHWTAHWLAVEGVQPLIPENPPAIPRDNVPPAESSGSKLDGLTNGTTTLTNGLLPGSKKPTSGSGQVTSSASPSTPLVKHVLSRELQLYYNRLTTSLLPPSNDFTKRTAALASLRQDAGLQALLPYLIRWVGEGVVGALRETGENTEEDTKGANGATAGGAEATRARTLDVLMDVIAALLENSTLFAEPYLHQLLPPILSTLLHSSLPAAAASSASSSTSVPGANPTPTHLRTSASSTLSRLLRQHSTTYPSLSPRIMKTLLLALLSPSKDDEAAKKNGTREGAIRGLIGVGKEAVRKGIVEGGGARVVERECEGYLSNGMSDGEGEDGLVNSVLDALRVLKPSTSTTSIPTTSPQDMDVDPTPALPLDLNSPDDASVYERLRELVGDAFAERVRMADDREWVREIVGVGRG